MITLRDISKSYGTEVSLAPTSYAFKRALTTAIIGPSGCGKSTMLRIILGLISPDTGSVEFDGEIINSQNIQGIRHRIGYVVQDGGLFPHLTCLDNVTLMAQFLKMDGATIDKRVDELAALVQLPIETLSRFPAELSGGQRQRIGLMRALMLDPVALLLDEPMGALDPITRNELQHELKRIFTPLGKTVLIVTHDMREAAFFGHEILLMRDAHIVQSGRLEELMEQPVEPYVTDFIRAQQSDYLR